MTKLPYGCADEDGLYHITGNFMTKPKPYTKDELKWARKAAKKLGIKDPEAFLEMRWSEVTKLCREKGLDWAITPAPVAPKKKPRRASASRPKKPSSTSSSGTSRSKA